MTLVFNLTKQQFNLTKRTFSVTCIHVVALTLFELCIVIHVYMYILPLFFVASEPRPSTSARA